MAIKTPVKRVDYELTDSYQSQVKDATGLKICDVVVQGNASLIVAALNAQQPKCKTCGGSGVMWKLESGELRAKSDTPKNMLGIEISCPRCKGTGIEPAEPSGELVEAIELLSPCGETIGELTVEWKEVEGTE